MQLLPLEGKWLGPGLSYALPFAEKMAKRYPHEWPVDVIVEAAAARELTLWLIWDEEKKEAKGCVGTRVIIKASGKRILDIAWIAGDDREEWIGLISVLEQYGTDLGCSEIEFIGREGWKADLPDYRGQRQVRYTKELANERSEAAVGRTPEGLRDDGQDGGDAGAVGTGPAGIGVGIRGSPQPIPVKNGHGAP